VITTSLQGFKLDADATVDTCTSMMMNVGFIQNGNNVKQVIKATMRLYAVQIEYLVNTTLGQTVLLSLIS
jgi:hypothetical protein